MQVKVFTPPNLSDERPTVSVIIVNYNGVRFMHECLESLLGAFEKYTFEIIVVDNASTDGSREWLRNRKDIVYIESDENTGFTGGNNLGAEYAKGDRLLFINNDTHVLSKLDPMIDLLNRPEIGLTSCHLQYGDQRQQFSMGFDHTPLRILLSWLGVEKLHHLPSVFRRLETDPAAYQKNQNNVSWVSGACFAIRHSEWTALSGFDTAFFMYCEDVDLCLRVRQLGLRIAYTTDCQVIHYEGAGKDWIGHAALKRTVRSYQIFTKKHYGYFAALGLSLGLGIIFYLRSAAFRALSLANKNRRSTLAEKSIGFGKAATLLFTSLSSESMKKPNP